MRVFSPLIALRLGRQPGKKKEFGDNPGQVVQIVSKKTRNTGRYGNGGLKLIKIVSLNAWGGRLHDALLTFLQAEAPDILCLQEVVHSPETSMETLTYRDGNHVLVQRANLFREVCAVLPDHQATFCPAAEGVLWDQATAVPSQWGLATFVHRDLHLIGQVQGFVHKDFSANGYGEHPRSRSAHGVRVHDAKREKAICVVHMHGLRDLNGKGDTPERIAQAHRFASMADSLRQAGDRLVMCGDFNVEPDSQTFNILERLRLKELVADHKIESTRTSHYKKPGRFADYMLIDANVKRYKFEVMTQPEVSDHCPLVLSI